MDLCVDPRSPVPPSRQLVEGLLGAVARGALGVGDQLPSVRSLAAAVVLNPNTVERAIRELQALGVAEGRPGAGVFVTPRGPALARRRRRAQTLADLRRALRAAVEAGHAPETLGRRFARWLGPTLHPAAEDPRR